MRAAGLCAIQLVAPTTPDDRLKIIVPRASGFVYCVSREGVTGMQERISDRIAELCARLRRHTDLPIAVGFGVSNAEQARAVAQHADAVVVGSAVVDQVARHAHEADLAGTVASFVCSLLQAVKRP